VSLPGTWDRLAMEQIIDNLVSNAIKYGAHRPVEICAEDHGDNVGIRVRDHGPGIPVDARSRILAALNARSGRMNDAAASALVYGWSVSSLTQWEARSEWTMHREAARYSL
jgi:K+-sensing histidine kinase KdpD